MVEKNGSYFLLHSCQVVECVSYWSDTDARNWHLVFYFSLKVEYDKLANEKTEMQRHYVMVRLCYKREQLWFQMARLVEDLVGVERDRLLWSPAWWLGRAECQVQACERPRGGFDVAGCYGGALPDRQWAEAPLKRSPDLQGSAAALPSVCWSDYSPRRLHAQTYAWP